MVISTKSARRYLTTVRHLRFCQITGQLRRRLYPLFERPHEQLISSKAAEFPGCRWHLRESFLPPGAQGNSEADMLSGHFSFLNAERNLGWPPTWDYEDASKLWHYNLHYFDFLWSLEYEQAKCVVQSWIVNHPIGRAQVGWEPYPISVRLVNWCGIFFGKYRKHTEADGGFLQKLWGSIYLQAEWLTRHLETHLLGNHLFENGAALVFLGNCFSGSAAGKWVNTGSSILKKEIPEQILSDGTHFERSPMYHLRVTYLLAMLLNINRPDLQNMVREPLSRMLTALEKLCHPDGKITLFNDSAFGIYKSPLEVITYGRTLIGNDKTAQDDNRSGTFALPEAGYYGFRDQEGTYIICDAAPVGPDYIPGHGHADMFSFELSLNGHRVIVDGGVYDYELGQMRDYCRSTKAHNTVEIDGRDQCEMWAAFRVARRGHPYDVKWLPSESGFRLSGWHDGYKRLKGKPVHHREFTWHNSGTLTVKDRIIVSCPKSITSRLHLHPDCSIDKLEADSVWISYPAGKLTIAFSGGANLSVEDSFYCPEFGKKLENKALVYHTFGDNVEISFMIQSM